VAYTYDDLRNLPDDWDGEPNSARPSETSIRVLQSLESAVLAAGLPAHPEPDAWQGCGFHFESSSPDVFRTAWLHVADRGTVIVVLTERRPRVCVNSLPLDPADPGPALAKVVAFLSGPPVAAPRVPGRATTEAEKRAVIEDVLRLWLLMPEQRLGQLLLNAMGTDGRRLALIEDADLAGAVAALVARAEVPAEVSDG